MHLHQFQYEAPGTIKELVSILSKHKEKARILAGGTDLMVQMKGKVIKPEYIIDINGIDELSYIDYKENKGLKIGTGTKIETIERSDIIKEKYYALHKGASVIGSTQVRAMATVGGNSCNASPCADTVSPLVSYDAKVNLVSDSGNREIALEEFIQNNGVTSLKPDEFLESFSLIEPWANSVSKYQQMGLRDAMEIDMVNVAVNVALDPGSGKIDNIRIVLGSVAPSPLRGKNAEKILLGNVPDDKLIEKAADACVKDSMPIDDLRASADYRREVVGVLTKRVLKEAIDELSK